MKYPRFLLAAGASGSGKTTITCGILECLRRRGKKAASFKCGPDYIDPLFHETVLDTPSANLDTFFTDVETTRYLFAENAKDAQISVIEGVMGYYDGLGGTSERASAYDVARVLDAPVVLIVDTKGMSLSVLAYLKGFLTYRADSRIRGVILNRMSPMLYPQIREQIERELGIRVYGYVPKLVDCVLESRHLGLVLPEEVGQWREKLDRLAAVLEESLDIDGLLALGESAGELSCAMPQALQELMESERVRRVREAAPRVALAKDAAFCFIYKDNLRLLRALGARLEEFSPLGGEMLPPDCDGLLLYGGYPELHAKELCGQTKVRTEIKERVLGGLPCMAECGGFLYLHDTMEDMEGRAWQMAGVIPARAYRTEKLGRFGYVTLEAEDLTVRAHEFHYFESTDCGDAFKAVKPLRGRFWRCIHRTETMMAGFPHLYYYSNPEAALSFLEKCVK